LKLATDHFLKDKPNVAAILPAMDRIHAHFKATLAKPELSPALRAALSMAQKTLDRYYGHTDVSEIYHIAMSWSRMNLDGCVFADTVSLVLHPSCKLDYFHEAEWPQEWIDTARNIIREEYNRAYRCLAPVSKPAPLPPSSKKAVKPFANLFKVGMAKPLRNELDSYLAAPCEELDDQTSTVQWWARNTRIYPTLSRMAMDYLSIPATSVDVECMFSKGRRLLSYERNRMSGRTIHMQMCVGEWVRLGFVRDNDISYVTKAAREDHGDAAMDVDEELESWAGSGADE